MVINHGEFIERARSQQIKAEDIQVRRGTIVDREGREFAVNVDLESLFCDPEEVEIDNTRLQKLASTLQMNGKVLRKKLAQEKRFVWIKRKLEPATVAAVGKLNISGCGFITEAKRIYPKDELASHIVGAVGLDNQPLEGIELRFNKYLTASGGKVYFSRDASGKILSSGVDTESRGNDLVLTVDEVLQYTVEKELDKAMRQWRAAAAAAVMMDPHTGEILALANRPAHDLNRIGSADSGNIRNRVVTDIYEPGSTFKIIVGTAALEEKVCNLNSRFDCSRGSIEVGGKNIRDSHKNGVLSFTEVIQKSSNVGSILIGMKLGKEKIYKYTKLFGFGEQTGVDLPGEVSGWIRNPEKWSATSLGAIPIGQEVAVTPLQVLRAYAAIANGGYLVRPHVVAEIRTPDGTVLSSYANDDRKRILSEQTALTFRNILKTVAEEGGTATGAAVDGNAVAGKTGTAQMVDPATRRYSRDRYISSFVGFVPADNPRIAMIVVIYEPKGQIYGGVVAAPVFRNIADQALSYLNVPREDSSGKQLLLVSQ